MKFSPENWYRIRTYLHFDLPISEEKATKVVTNQELVGKHAFFPLIHYTQVTKKLSNNPIPLEIKSKNRDIAYPAHLDSHIYAYYAKMLAHFYDNKLVKAKLDKSILAFRALNKSNVGFAYDAFNEIKALGDCCAVALDVSAFFDTLDHQILKNKWCELLEKEQLPKDHFNIYRAIIMKAQVNKEKVYKLFNIPLHHRNRDRFSQKKGSRRQRLCSPTEFRTTIRANNLITKNEFCYGIPQGTPLSAMLSNIYMFDFDIAMKKFVDECNGKYFRYCDDMLFIVPIGKEKQIEALATKEIKSLELTINEKKTEIRTFRLANGVLKADKHLQYLGFQFDGENIFIRSSSLSRYRNRMHRAINLAKRTEKKYNIIRTGNSRNNKDLFKRKLYSRYTHFGRRNFITYGIKAAKLMESETIKRQLKPLFNRFRDELNK